MITSQEPKSLATQKCTESGPKKPAARALDLVARKTNSTIGNALGKKKSRDSFGAIATRGTVSENEKWCIPSGKLT